MPHSFFVRYMSLSLILEQSVETVPSLNDIFVKQLHECTWRGVLLRMENYGFSMKCLCNGSIRKKGRAAIKHLEDKHRDQLSNINITFVKKQNSHRCQDPNTVRTYICTYFIGSTTSTSQWSRNDNGQAA